VGGGIGDFTFQIIFMIQKYELKNISKFVISFGQNATLIMCHSIFIIQSIYIMSMCQGTAPTGDM
jgi:hypothetical protein